MDGKEIRGLRTANGVKQVDLARALAIPAEVLSLIESEKVLATPRQIETIGRFFGRLKTASQRRRNHSRWIVVTSVRKL